MTFNFGFVVTCNLFGLSTFEMVYFNFPEAGIDSCEGSWQFRRHLIVT